MDCQHEDCAMDTDLARACAESRHGISLPGVPLLAQPNSVMWTGGTGGDDHDSTDVFYCGDGGPLRGPRGDTMDPYDDLEQWVFGSGVGGVYGSVMADGDGGIDIAIQHYLHPGEVPWLQQSAGAWWRRRG